MSGSFERSGNTREILDLAPACLRIQPFDSRRSHSSIGVLTYISRKFSFPTIDAAISLKSLFGLIKAAIVITPVSIKSLLTSAIRRIFSTRSSAEKPRLLLIPLRILSPSRMQAQQTALVQLALKRYRHRALPGTAQPGKPHHHTALLQQTLLILPWSSSYRK